MSNPESRIYENEQQEKIKKIDNNKDTNNDANNDINKLSITIGKIENKLKKIGNGENFFMKNMNDYLENKYNCKFEKTTGKDEFVLVFDKGQENKIKDLADKLKIIEGKGSSEVYIDENKDDEKNKNEIGVKINKNETLETDSIYLSQDEAKNKMVSFGKDSSEGKAIDEDYTKGGKLVYENNKVYYEVGKHGDKLAAVSRLFTAVSDEFFDGMNINQINKKIKNLHYNKDTGEFKNFDDGKKIESGYKIVGDFYSEKWYKIVQPGAKIDITSLSKAIVGKQIIEEPKVEQKIEKKETNDWGRFYESSNGEIYDVPDQWTDITYHGYSKKYDHLNGSQISIGAKSMYDFNNKDKKNDNQFSLKDKITLNGKEAFLLVGEGDLSKNINKTSQETIKNSLSDSGLEAWLIVKGKDGKNSITEVGDEKVHTITETSDKVERGEDKDHSIVLSGDEYEFSGKFSGSINFSGIDFDNSQKGNNLKLDKKSIVGLNSKNFNNVFPGGKGYLQVKGHLVEVSLDKDKKINFKNLGKEKTETLGNSGVSIFSKSFSGLEFNKDNGYIKFPKLEGWGKIEGKLSKHKNETKITLSDDYKIGGKNIEIDLGKNKESKKLTPSEIQTKIIAGLLLLEKNKDELKNKGRSDNNIDIKDDEIIVNPFILSDEIKKLIKGDSNNKLFTYQKDKENKDTYIFDKIKTDVGKELV